MKTKNKYKNISTESESTGSGLNVKRNYGGFYEKGTDACQQVARMMLAREKAWQ